MIAIDLGSNTLRIVQISCKSKEILNEYETAVKTADGLAKYGLINDEAIARVILALKEAQEKINFSTDTVRAVTTEAVRRASNADKVLSQIKKETGVSFEIISGEEEARLTLLAVKYRLDKLEYSSDAFVLADIGGASTELIFHYKNETISKSFPIGIVTIAQTYKTLENIQNALLQEMREMQMFCTKMHETKGRVNSFIATAGTPTTVAAMKLGQNHETYDRSKINGTFLTADELDFYFKKLLQLPFEERELIAGTGRSDLITAGILIYKQLYTMLDFDTCVIIDDGLREGVALEMCK